MDLTAINTRKRAAILLLGGLLIGVYAMFDPGQYSFFPSCPFHSLTGLLCPGCGSQRAIHQLLNLQVVSAYHQNALLVLSIPYVLLGFVFEKLKRPSKTVLKWRQRLYGRNAIILVLFIILFFSVLRNLNL